MILHKLIESAEAGQYLPFALARLRALERIYSAKGFFQEKYQVPGFEVEVQQSPPFQYIRIRAAGAGYEFFTSESVDDTLFDPRYPGYVAGSATRASLSATSAKAKPIYSTELDPGTPPKWKLRAYDYPPARPDSGFLSWGAWNFQRNHEHVWHSGTRALVTSTQGQTPGIANKCGWNSPYVANHELIPSAFVADYGEDVAPALYTADATIIGAPTLENPWLYWRHAAVQTVKGRKFFICTDNFGRFHVYTAVFRGNPGTDNNWRVAPGHFKTYTPPYPGWVTLPDINNPLHVVNDWLWRFNSDATKCVSLPFHAELADSYKYIGDPPEQLFASLLPEDPSNFGIDGSRCLQAHDDTPGLVEFGITIASTGPNETDFEVSFPLLRTSYFGDNSRFIFDCAYFLKDVDKVGVATDTLMTAEIECKVPSTKYSAELHYLTPPFDLYAYDGVQAMRSEFVINANDASLNPTEKLRFEIAGPMYWMYPNTDWVRANRDGPPTPTPLPFDAIEWGGSTIPTAYGDKNFFPFGPYRYGEPCNFLKNAFIWALELSTLSIVYSEFNHVAQTGQLRGLSFGTEFYQHDLTPDLRNVPALETCTVAVPSARPYITMLGLLMANEDGRAFSVHPSGNWSFEASSALRDSAPDADAGASLDWISVVTGKDADGKPTRKRFRHKDLYNKAFGQSRDYPLYLSDHGGFRKQGIWVSFR